MYIPQKGQGLTHAGADVGFRASISTSRMSLVCLFLTVAAVSMSFQVLQPQETLSRQPDFRSARSKADVVIDSNRVAGLDASASTASRRQDEL
jgi:hypothetical protein